MTLESVKNTATEFDSIEKIKLSPTSLEMKQNNTVEAKEISDSTMQTNVDTNVFPSNETMLEKRKRNSETILLTSSKKHEKMTVKKEENRKEVQQPFQNLNCSVVPTGPKSQRNIFQLNTCTKNSKSVKTNNSKKQDKRGSLNTNQKDNVEFRVRTLDEIREEKAAKLRQIEKNKELVADDQKENTLSKGSSNITENSNNLNNSTSSTDTINEDKRFTEYDKSEIQSEVPFSQNHNLEQSKNLLTNDVVKNDVNFVLLPPSDDDLDFLNDSEDKMIDINIVQNGNNDLEDDELAAFERELEM